MTQPNASEQPSPNHENQVADISPPHVQPVFQREFDVRDTLCSMQSSDVPYNKHDDSAMLRGVIVKLK